ncbi:transposable element gene, partial [Prunus dulcis]
FPDGYASNIARCVNVDGGKFTGLKSHDCHVFMQRLLPVGIRHLLPEDVVKPIIFLHKYDARDGSLARRGIASGPVNYRWMYPIERLLGELKKVYATGQSPKDQL